MTPNDDDRRLVNDASNHLQLMPDLLLPPITRPGSNRRQFTEIPNNQVIIDNVVRTYRTQAVEALRNEHHVPVHDPDHISFKIGQVEAMESIAKAIEAAAQEDRFS